MVGPRIYHVHQTRCYAGFTNPSAAFEAMNSWLRSSDFKVHRRNNTFSRGSKHGVHVNFVPKFRLLVEPCPDGSTIVKFDYYGKMKVGTLVVVGILTSGISTAVGVATYAMRLLEADQFAATFWSFVDTLARGTITVLKVERWGHDRQGRYVQQAAVPVAVQQPTVVVQQPVMQQPIVVQQPVMVPYGVPMSQAYYPSQQGAFPPQQQAPVSTSKSLSSGYPGNYNQQQNNSQPYLTNANSQQLTSNTSQRQLPQGGYTPASYSSPQQLSYNSTQQPYSPSQLMYNPQDPYNSSQLTQEYTPAVYTSSQQPQIYGNQASFNYSQPVQYPQHPQQPQQSLPQQYYPTLDRQPLQSSGGTSSYSYPPSKTV